MRSVSILEGDWTPVERHHTGDHRQCGVACTLSGQDVRESPIYDECRLFWDTLATVKVADLRAFAKANGVVHYSRLGKADLIEAIKQARAKSA